MNNYVQGQLIKKLRINKKMTQEDLANVLSVSDKTISKWECGKGYPDISMLEPLAKALDISVIELLNGENIINNNVSSNMKKVSFKVCPICHNIITSVGESVNVCCGITMLPALINEDDDFHKINVEIVENEYFVTIKHQMTKEHYISFIAYVTSDRVEIIKLYPEQDAQGYFFRRGSGYIYAYCIKDGMYRKTV